MDKLDPAYVVVRVMTRSGADIAALQASVDK